MKTKIKVEALLNSGSDLIVLLISLANKIKPKLAGEVIEKGTN
jgi:hypothetical protein